MIVDKGWVTLGARVADDELTTRAPMQQSAEECRRESYNWTQTKEDLNITIQVPPGTTTQQVTCRVSTDDTCAVELTLLGVAEPLLQGRLHARARSSIWWIEAGTSFILEIEKQRPHYWPCALIGGPSVDVEALRAKELRDREPAYKPLPDAERAPRQVRDREELLKLKAEFPQLAIELGDEPAAACHKPYTGQRKKFEWGSFPAPADGDQSGLGGGARGADRESCREWSRAGTAGQAAGSGTRVGPVASMSETAAIATRGDTLNIGTTAHSGEESQFSWGCLPTRESDTAKLTGGGHLTRKEEADKFTWGSLHVARD